MNKKRGKIKLMIPLLSKRKKVTITSLSNVSVQKSAYTCIYTHTQARMTDKKLN